MRRGIEVVGRWVDIHKDRDCACVGNRIGCRNERETGTDNFVSGPYAYRYQRQVQRRGAG